MASILVPLVNAFIEKLNAANNPNWSDYTVGESADDFVKAVGVLDPSVALESGTKGLYVIPVVTDFSLESSLGRQRRFALNGKITINTCLALPFQTADEAGFDVSSWEEICKVLTLREEIDKFLISQEWGYTVEEVTPSPAQEINLKRSWFLGVTEYVFDSMVCSSEIHG